MGSDLFGSLAESTVAALIVSATSPELIVAGTSALYYPIVITAFGILVSFVTTFHASNIATITFNNVESVLKYQLIISTVLMTAALYPLTINILPQEFTIAVAGQAEPLKCSAIKAFICVASGLWSGLIIGYITEYFTSN